MKKKIESIAELARMLDAGEIGQDDKVYYCDDDGQWNYAQNVSYGFFNRGCRCIEVPDEKSDREKCADMITQNEYVTSDGTCYYYCKTIYVGCENVYFDGNVFPHASFLAQFKSATKAERDAAMYN